MSQQHTDIDSDDPNQSDSHGIERFTRNRYFNGKLMTARDMQAEQRYHAGRLETLAQLVLGEGVVCGLDTDVNATEEGGVTVDVSPGVALDAAGRPVVVDGGDEVTFDPDTAADWEGAVSLYIELDACEAEKVPKPGSQDACSQNCEYNRVIEEYAIDAVEGRPAERKPIPDVAFPTSADLAAENTHDDADAPHQQLSTPARSYAMAPDQSGANRYVDCGTGGDERVFLGYYEEESGDWVRREVSEPRHHVYTNDMLYAGLARHVADFDNPHEVHLAVEELEGGVETLIRNERHLDNGGSPPYPGDVTFSSPDETLAIEGSSSDGVGAVTLDLGDDEQTTLGKVEPLETTVNEHLDADNPHGVVSAIGGDGEAVPPGDGVVDLVSADGIEVQAVPDDHEVGVGLDQDVIEEMVHDFLTELVGPFDEEDWEQVRNAIRSINGVGGDEEGGLTLESESKTVAIEEAPDNNSITIDIGQETLDRLDELESRLDALESDGVDIGQLDLDPHIRDVIESVDLSDYLPDYDRIRTQIDRIDPLETEIQDINDQVSTLDTQFTDISDQVSTLDNQYSQIDTQVGDLDNEIQSVQSSVEAVNEDLASTAKNVETLSTSLNEDHGIAVPQFDSTTLNINLQNYSDVIYRDTNFNYEL